MPLDSWEFRRVLGHLVTGVSIVAAAEPDRGPCGLTANAVCSVSLEPPLVLACIEKTADTHDCIRAAGCYAVSVLRNEDERLARRFSTYALERKFDGVAYREETTGAPVIEGALAWVDCRVWAEYDGGDHTIFVGEVLAADATEGAPLLYYRGGYGRFLP